MLLYAIMIIILILITLYLYYKFKHPFWSRQPVFHIHNLLYWYDPPGIIQQGKPERNKYYKADIEFDSFDNISSEINCIAFKLPISCKKQISDCNKPIFLEISFKCCWIS